MAIKDWKVWDTVRLKKYNQDWIITLIVDNPFWGGDTQFFINAKTRCNWPYFEWSFEKVVDGETAGDFVKRKMQEATELLKKDPVIQERIKKAVHNFRYWKNPPRENQPTWILDSLKDTKRWDSI